MVSTPLYNLGSIGIVKDIPPHLLPPEAWSDGKNVRFQDNIVTRIKGHERVFGTPTVIPTFLLNLPTATSTFWIYPSLTKAYVYENGVHTNITRQTASVDVDYTAVNYRDWNGGILGGIPILNNGSDVPQYWAAISAATKLANLTNWPSTLRAKIVRPFGPFLVALNINDNSTLYPHMFWWSHPADPGALPASWDYTNSAYDAGRKELTDTEGGQLIDALMLKNYLIMYKETSTHYLRFVGGQEVMANDLMFAGSGILAPRCMCLIMEGTKHFVATADDIIVHNGQSIESLLDKKNKKFLLTDRDNTNFRNSFCVHNPGQKEAWFCYPSVGATYPDKVFIWNYSQNTMQFRDFKGTYAVAGLAVTTNTVAWDSASEVWDTDSELWSDEGRRELIMADPSSTLIYRADTNETFDGTNINAFVERTGLAVVGKDRQGQPKADARSRKLLKRIWPKITGSGTITVRAGAQENHNDAVVWGNPISFTIGTDKFVDVTANGRLLAVRFESNDTSQWKLEGYDADIEALGEY